MLQRTFERVRRIELELGVPPSHYEPGAPTSGHEPTTGAHAGRRGQTEEREAREAVSTASRATPRARSPATPTTSTAPRNPVVRRLMAGFERTLEELFRQADPQSLLDVGCGEAVLTHEWAQQLAPRRVVGIDLEDPAIQAEWEQRKAPNLEYRIMKAENLPFADAEFDVATAIEVLEHVPDPAHTVAEMARVRPALAARLGAARAAVARAQHGARRLPEGSRQHARARQPLVQARASWRCCRATARSSRRARRSRGRCCSSGSERGLAASERCGRLRPRRAHPLDRHRARPGSSRSRTSRSRRYVLDDVEYKQISLLWSVLFVTVSVIYRPIEQLLSRTIADRRARGFEPTTRCARRC